MVRFRRDSVCTQATPLSFLSTYMATSLGWSKPVWNLLATIRKRYSSASKRSAVAASGKPFILASVYSLPSLASFTTSVKATSALNGLPMDFK